MKLMVFINAITGILLLCFFGPFSLGILFASTKLDEERHKLELSYKICRTVAIIGLVLVALTMIYSPHRILQ